MEYFSDLHSLSWTNGNVSKAEQLIYRNSDRGSAASPERSVTCLPYDAFQPSAVYYTSFDVEMVFALIDIEGPW